ncbi:MAG: hypothetical protein GY861_20520 [bacterium]|nr:hypothetical protein [bacterium]
MAEDFIELEESSDLLEKEEDTDNILLEGGVVSTPAIFSTITQQIFKQIFLSI